MHEAIFIRSPLREQGPDLPSPIASARSGPLSREGEAPTALVLARMRHHEDGMIKDRRESSTVGESHEKWAADQPDFTNLSRCSSQTDHGWKAVCNRGQGIRNSIDIGFAGNSRDARKLSRSRSRLKGGTS